MSIFPLGLSLMSGGRKERCWVGSGAVKNLQTRRRVVSAEEGQDFFAWPTTRDAVSLQLLIERWQLARSASLVQEIESAAADRARP
jgi:hypothetical protein